MDQEKEHNTPHGVVSPTPETSTTPETTEAPVTTTPETKKEPFYKSGPGLAVILAIIIILGAGAYVYLTQYHNGGVAAVVNGEKLYNAELDENTERILGIAQLQGQDTENPQLRSSIEEMSFNIMVDNLILVQAAEGAGFSVTPEEVEERYEEEVANYESEEMFLEQLETINLPIETLKENIHDELLVKKYFDSEIDPETIVATEEEIAQQYNGFLAANEGTEDLPTLEELEGDIESLILDQKRKEVIEELVQELKEEAEIIEK